MEIFAYGTYSDYVSQRESLPEMTPPMDRKLKMLTLASLAAGRRQLAYDDLQRQLSLPDVRQLEDLIIEAQGMGVIKGKLDQRRGFFLVDFFMARDIRGEEISQVAEALESWCASCDAVLDGLERQASAANAEKARHVAHRQEIERKVAEIKSQLKQATEAGGEDPDSRMDLGQQQGAHHQPESSRRDGKKAAKGKGLRGSAAASSSSSKGFWQK